MSENPNDSAQTRPAEAVSVPDPKPDAGATATPSADGSHCERIANASGQSAGVVNPDQTRPARLLFGGKPNRTGRPRGIIEKVTSRWKADIEKVLNAKSVAVNFEMPDGRRSTFALKADSSIRYAIAVAMVREALKGDTRAAEILMDRTEGKPLQTIQGDGQTVIVATEIIERREQVVDGGFSHTTLPEAGAVP